MLGPVGSGLWELPVTALSDYARCPKRFQFRFIEGHPGMGEGIGMARRVGTLVHKALELDIRDINALASFDATLPQESVREAVELAQRFDQSTIFANVRDTSTGREQAITFNQGKLTLNGVVDLVGKDWVLDFKTSEELHPEYHRFQLWAYAAAMGYSTAHIAYLRGDILHTFSPEKIQATAHEASALVENILAARYPTKPSQENCTLCAYQEVCKEKHTA
jgi:ATP-dependent helicase/nuclease subunit A